MLCKDHSKPCAPKNKITSTVEEFAPLPNVAMRVMEIVADPESNVTDIEEILQSDISLVTSVLKLANSAFYGVRRQVDSLRHALLLLGKQEVQSLVMSRVLLNAFKVPQGVEKDILTNTWRHSLECAISAETIACHLGLDDPIYFLGGMLHDLGKLVIVQKFLHKLDQNRYHPGLSEEDGLRMEHEALGCGHDELGAMLLHRWMFPEEIEAMVREHHLYDQIAACRKSCQIMIIANLMARYVVAKNLLEQGTVKEAVIIALHNIIMGCGSASKIVKGTEDLMQIERSFRNNLNNKAKLLEILSI